ncbi:MAG: nucleotidyltransferase domain-containing protein [Oscillospiraceae bacterium]|nr:nucleotidyltransferase domain-containing protein [Oscillospiraceae bacterium]
MLIDDVRKAVETVAADLPIIRRVTLFGSVANGTNTESSDVDLIIEFSGPVTLLTIASIKDRLESLLDTDVDIIHGPIRDTDMIEIDKEIEIYAA